MSDHKETYTGFLVYHDINFSFILANDELKLIPPPDKSKEIRFTWLMKEIEKGTFVNGDPLIVEDSSIIGTCNETNGQIVLFPRVGSIITSNYNIIGNNAPILRMSLSAYILCKYERDSISRLSFSGPEINYIHPVNQAISLTFDDDANKCGIIKLETNDFSSTTTQDHAFYVDGKMINSKYGISREISTKIDKSPLTLKSTMMFEFEPSSDYGFILHLCQIAKDYISYLCYRRNVTIDEIELYAPYKDEMFEGFASLHMVGNCCEPEEKALKNSRNIKQIHIDIGENRILQDIADNTLYLRHLPTSYESGRHIDAARFVMITAAFEWEFRRMKPDGLPKTESRMRAEENANTAIDELIASRTGKEKEIYKFLKKLIGGASLQNEIVSACEELDTIVGAFGKHLYAMNNEELVYSDMGKRLSDQRNHFAHGDIDKDFIGTSLLDLIFLEYIIYAMQLHYYGVDDVSIRKAINELFHLSFAV